jgi:hypothetical protein
MGGMNTLRPLQWFDSEYERLYRWRALWSALNAKREPNRLQSRQDRIDAKAEKANNAIRRLMREFDQQHQAALTASREARTITPAPQQSKGDRDGLQ